MTAAFGRAWYATRVRVADAVCNIEICARMYSSNVRLCELSIGAIKASRAASAMQIELKKENMRSHRARVFSETEVGIFEAGGARQEDLRLAREKVPQLLLDGRSEVFAV